MKGEKMEKNYISEYQPTGFYTNIENRTYGVCINVKDVSNAENIIDYFKKTRKNQIECWKNEWSQCK